MGAKGTAAAIIYSGSDWEPSPIVLYADTVIWYVFPAIKPLAIIKLFTLAFV